MCGGASGGDRVGVGGWGEEGEGEDVRGVDQVCLAHACVYSFTLIPRTPARTLTILYFFASPIANAATAT